MASEIPRLPDAQIIWHHGFMWKLFLGFCLFLVCVVVWGLFLRSNVTRCGWETRAKSNIASFHNALSQYWAEYQHFPVALFSSKDESVLLRTQGQILRTLFAKDKLTNPREIKFYEPLLVNNKKGGLYYDEHNAPVLVDPWGEPFYFMIDFNDDGKIPNPDPRKDQPRELAPSIIVFSSGPDRDPTTWEDNIKSW